MPCSISRFLARFVVGLIVGMGFSFPTLSHAEDTGTLQGKGKIQARVAQTVVTSPYGGLYSVDAARWSGSNGTVVVTYSHNKMFNGWVYNGGWSYTGSVTANNIFNGSLTGTLNIVGLDLGIGPMDLNVDLGVVFSGGQAIVTLTYALPATVVNGVTIANPVQTTTLHLRQEAVVGFLL